MKNKSSGRARCLAVVGTGSDVGKDIVTTALCRSLVRQGRRVAPYKAQSISNNSGVTPEGLEIGRSQIVQAEAAKVSPHVDMNPILLKPAGDIGFQVVLLGKTMENSTAVEYYREKEIFFSTAARSLDRLRDRYEMVVMEEAGSCGEVTRMAHDGVNLAMAEYADAPVLIVVDIHEGRAGNQVVKALEGVSEGNRGRIAGVVVNRCRDDVSLFNGDVEWIEKKTGKKVFGVVKGYDSMGRGAGYPGMMEDPGRYPGAAGGGGPAIALLHLPHISNTTDFDPLHGLDGLTVDLVESIKDLKHYPAVILPGSKRTRSDLEWLGVTGWDKILQAYADSGGHILGICGGYQIMGRSVHDPDGIEGRPGCSPGLGLLPVETILKAPKITTRTTFNWQGIAGTGYEIHMGHTHRQEGPAMFSVSRRNNIFCRDEDGCIAQGGRLMGTYMHGLFDDPGIVGAWLGSIGLGRIQVSEMHGARARDREYDRLAEYLERHVDTEGIMKSFCFPAEIAG